MNYYFSKVFLSDDAYNDFIVHDRQVLEPLNKINFFVGANNSGKSILMRRIYSSNNIRYIHPLIELDEFNEINRRFSNIIMELLTDNGLHDYNEIRDYVEEHYNISWFESNQRNTKWIKELFDIAKGLDGFVDDEKVIYLGDAIPKRKFIDKEDFSQEVKYTTLEWRNVLHGLTKEEFDNEFLRIYIPTLRGLRPFSDENDYKNRTARDYFRESEFLSKSNNESIDKFEIFTGIDMYENVTKLLLGNLRDREIIGGYQLFLKDNFFEGEDVVLIPSINSDVLYVKIGEEKEQPIYNLGDGLQQIIIITFPIFINADRKVLAFIEEPELFLHPGLQRKLLESLMRMKNCQIFMTTHSNHFLDLTLDIESISVFTLDKRLSEEEDREKTPQFIINNVSNEDSKTLELLGVKNSSVLLSNCTIWVEGITDRLYLRHYFKIYQEELHRSGKSNLIYREDYHYSFVEYGGNNITHWSFLEDGNTDNNTINIDRLCSRIFLIADKDSENKSGRHEKLSEKLNERFYLLECREVENLISETVLINVISDYEKLEVGKLQFRSELKQDDYADKPLGKFIEEGLLQKKRRGMYYSGAGTVSQKSDFCRKAIAHTRKVDQLSKETIILCQKIYEFIKESN